MPRNLGYIVVAMTTWLTMSCGALTDMDAEHHRNAYGSERSAVALLRQLDGGVSRSELREIRPRYDEAIANAKTLRSELKSQLEQQHQGRWFGKSDLAAVITLNDDLIRCHETLGERAAEAFRYMEDGRARRGFRHDVWGFIDPRNCFDELAPIIEGYLP